jgi:hypothetical protein
MGKLSDADLNAFFEVMKEINSMIANDQLFQVQPTFSFRIRFLRRAIYFLVINLVPC